MLSLKRENCLQVGYGNLQLFSSLLQATLSRCTTGSSSKIHIQIDARTKQVLDTLGAQFQAMHETLSNPTGGYAVMTKFPFSAMAGQAFASARDEALTQIKEVCSTGWLCSAAVLLGSAHELAEAVGQVESIS